MTMRHLIPWRERGARPAASLEPFGVTPRDVEDLLAEASAGERTRDRFFPRLDVSESAEGFRVSVELPGVDEKDVQVVFEDGLLVIAGRKTDERDEKGRTWYRRERIGGEFQRAIELPSTAEPSKTTATFTKGVLTVDVAKRAEARTVRRTIEVKSA